MAGLATLLGFLELFHLVNHVDVLFGIRVMPRTWMVTLRSYIVLDVVTVFAVNFLYLRQLQWLAALQGIQHLFYIFTWDKSQNCRKVISWISLDWTGNWVTLDVFLPTVFDTCLHAINLYLLSQFMDNAELLLIIAINVALHLAVTFNPMLPFGSKLSFPGLFGAKKSLD